MNDLISFQKTADFSNLRLERTKGGNVVTPWFSFDWREEGVGSPAQIGSFYHVVVDQAKEAFARTVGLRANDIMVSELRDKSVDGGFRWRLSTIRPCAIPAKKRTLAENLGAIDV